MKKLIACRGLPGSGKSTWANELCHITPGFVMVSKDAIRANLKLHNGWVWSQAAEKRDVIPARDALMRDFLRAGYSVISDDTNLTSGHIQALALIASLEGAEFEIQSFLHVSVDLCIERDAERAIPVGAARIRDMAKYVDAEQVT